MTQEDIKRIENIVYDIIQDVEWVNDSHTISEHAGVVSGLDQLINHLKETQPKS
tara:strand:- start:66 stop:227 length:162 start_codon:yes stop_codon:yes gene_type:complete